MKGMLDLETLTRRVEAGEIDTVLVCFPDVQGRLMGKRVTGHFFLDSVAEETHACNYLLTVDMEMEPVPGYEAASWDLGYGDFVIKPDMRGRGARWRSCSCRWGSLGAGARATQVRRWYSRWWRR